MKKNTFFLLFFYNIQLCWSIYVCSNNSKAVREEDGFYYGIENGEECIIDPHNQEKIEIEGYFDSCDTTEIKKYKDYVFYGSNDGKICHIDMDKYNEGIGADIEKVNKGFCRYCFFHRFENQLYIGYENGHECLLDMSSCSPTVEGRCTWCKPFVEINFQNTFSSHMPRLFTQDTNGKYCQLSKDKCGFYNMRNYNKTRRVCTYCSVVDYNKEKDIYYGREDYRRCEIEKKKCSGEINKFKEFYKRVSSESASNVSFSSLNIIFNTLLLILLMYFFV